MKGLLFLGFIIVLLFVAYSMTQKEKVVEKFTDPTPTVNVPKVKVKPTALDTSSPAAYLPPVETVYGPAFGEISRVGSLPYKDPMSEPAPLKRLNETLVSIQGFMNFEAKSLEDQSDPSVQLPLTTVRGDQERLNSEVSVLKRNPGIDSSITQGQLDDILNNLKFLQKKHRTLTNAASTASIEGFENEESDDRITLAELKDTLIAIQAEMARLSASGTTDPVITARVNTLTQMKNNVQSIVDQVASGAMPESQIPILKTDKGKFLPLMSDPSQPLPKLIDQAKLPPSVANLFPAYQSGDITGAKIAQTLAESYGDAMFKGLSWGINLKFTSPNEVEAAKSTATSRLGKAAELGFNSVADISGSTAHAYINHPYDKHGSKKEARGEFEDATQSYDETRPELRGNGIAPKTKPAKLNWKERSQGICQNIKKAGYDPKDFGCLDTNIKVGLDYSWRGNARMVCTRLLSTPDPGLPETCGCPPLEWRGWKA
jgi:hypothetical protein